MKKHSICRICGKLGFKDRNLKINLSSGLLETTKRNIHCTYCKSFFVHEHNWQKLIDQNLTKNEKITKEGLVFLDELESNKRNRVKKSKNHKIINNKENMIYKTLDLIPESIVGFGIYIIIILFIVWLLGDYGGECGVDYGPRFFGEC